MLTSTRDTWVQQGSQKLTASVCCNTPGPSCEKRLPDSQENNSMWHVGTDRSSEHRCYIAASRDTAEHPLLQAATSKLLLASECLQGIQFLPLRQGQTFKDGVHHHNMGAEMLGSL